MRLNDNVAVPATKTHLQQVVPSRISSRSTCSSNYRSNLCISIAFRSVATFVSPATGQVFRRGARLNKNIHPIPRHVASTIPLSIMTSLSSPPPPSSSLLLIRGRSPMARTLFSKDLQQQDSVDRAEESDTTDTTTSSLESSLSRQAKELIHAFSRENRCEDFVRGMFYGKGFDVVHVHAAMFGQDSRRSSSSSDHDDLVKTRTSTIQQTFPLSGGSLPRDHFTFPGPFTAFRN
jgi:hypothetical protein